MVTMSGSPAAIQSASDLALLMEPPASVPSPHEHTAPPAI